MTGLLFLLENATRERKDCLLSRSVSSLFLAPIHEGKDCSFLNIFDMKVFQLSEMVIQVF